MSPPAVTWSTFWHQNPTSTSINSTPSVSKIGWNAFHWVFWDMVLARFSGRTDSRTHSRTDRPENRMPPAPKVFGVLTNKQLFIRVWQVRVTSQTQNAVASLPCPVNSPHRDRLSLVDYNASRFCILTQDLPNGNGRIPREKISRSVCLSVCLAVTPDDCIATT